MRKKEKNLMSAIALTAAMTMLVGSSVMAAQSGITILKGANGVYVKNSGKDYVFEVELPEESFLGYTVDDKGNEVVDDDDDDDEPRKTRTPGKTAPPPTEASPDPTEEPSRGPVPDPTEEPSRGPVPDPTGEPSSGPVPDPTGEPSSGPVPDPTDESDYPAPSATSSSYETTKTGIFQNLISFLAPVNAQAAGNITKVVIPATYLDTLPEGNHVVKMNFTAGSVTTNIQIVAAGTNAATGDNTMLWPYIILAACSAGVMVFLGKKEKRA